MIRASIVVATYNRKEPLARLLTTLAEQSIAKDEYEVVVVDDGSREDATPTAMEFASVLNVSVLRQANAGVAVARQNGTEAAKGRIVIFLDDDMLVSADFVARHLEAHEGHTNRVVMGELLPDAKLAEMPLFERYHAYQLEKAASTYAREGGTFSGQDVYTGNLSLPRALFFEAGGFDASFHVEDVELGIRLEKAGATFVFSRSAATVHASDHTSLDKWLKRSVRDGRDWVRVIRKHPTVRAASPWRFLSQVNPLSRPFLIAAAFAPRTVPLLSRFVFRGAKSVDALGLDGAALKAMTLLYGIQYYRGVREETGSFRDAIVAYRAYRNERRAA